MGDDADAIVDRMSNPNPLAGVRVRRCRHELIVDQCGLCTPRKPTAPADPFESAAGLESLQYRGSGPGPWFPAQYDTSETGQGCSGCGSWIEEGDDIRADGSGGWEGRCCE